jgi:hypothetical protein
MHQPWVMNDYTQLCTGEEYSGASSHLQPYVSAACGTAVALAGLLTPSVGGVLAATSLTLTWLLLLLLLLLLFLLLLSL